MATTSHGSRRYEVISADTHVLEPPHIWDQWLPEKYREHAPKLVKDEDDGDAWLFPGSSDPDPIGLVATPGMPWDKFRWTGVTYEEARDGCYDGAARLQDMDADGIDAEVLFPPQRTIGHWLGHEDDDVVKAGVEAYNNFVWDEFTAPDRSRLIPLAQISSLGIDAAVAEVASAAERGFKGVIISNWPAGGDSLSKDDDPFWAAAAEAGLTVCCHINITSRAQRIAAKKASAGGVLGRGTGRDAKAKAVGGLGSVFARVAPNMASLIMTGTFERHPDLSFAWIEVGAGWIPHLLEQMDDRYWRNRGWAGLELPQQPSYYWYRNCSATFIVDRSAVMLRHAAGVDNIMWSTDYPHHGNDWPYSRKTIDEMMFDVPDDEKHKLIAGNAVRVFGLDQ
jgi:predicted TIM-barrel fold metal-dependent hydrolase